MLAVGYQLFWRWVRDQPVSELPGEKLNTVVSKTGQLEAK
jgi:hypothetical protein